MSDEGAHVHLDKVKEALIGIDANCPAFNHGCPFSNPQGRTPEDLVGRCPAFENGCPFSGKTPEQVQDLILEIPTHHKPCPVFAYSSSSASLKCEIGSTLVDFVKSIRNDLFITPLKEGTPPLSNEMLEGTLDVHAAAERCKFVKYLLKGKVGRDVYGRFLICLYHVYSAMEEEIKRLASHPIVGLVHFPRQVNRIEPLVKDLEFFMGPNWQEKASITLATQRYVEDIRYRAANAQHTFIAHPFTRYLGDMFGGQVLSRRIQRNFKLINQGGTAFYRFENIVSVPDFREFYLDRMNAIRVTEQEKEEIIQASRRVFELNIGIFEELGEELDDDEMLPSVKLKKPLTSSSKLALKRRGKSGSVESASAFTSVGADTNRRTSYFKFAAITLWVLLAVYYVYSKRYMFISESSSH